MPAVDENLYAASFFMRLPKTAKAKKKWDSLGAVEKALVEFSFFEHIN